MEKFFGPQDNDTSLDLVSTELPKFRFNASARLSDEERESVERMLDKVVMVANSVETTLSPERKEQLEYLIGNLVLWNQDKLGVNLSDRIPDLKKIVFTGSQEWEGKHESVERVENNKEVRLPKDEVFYANPYIWSKYFSGGGEKIVVEGSHNTISREIVLPETSAPAALNHELVHAFDDRVLKLQGVTRAENRLRIDTLGDTHLGYANSENRALLYLYETLTETRNIESLDWARRGDGRDFLSDYRMGYHEGVLFMDLLLGKIAEERGRKAVLEIYKGCVEGAMPTLKVFDEVFGPGTLKILSTLRGSSYHPGVLEWILENKLVIGAGGYAEKLAIYQQGEKVKLSSGITIERKSHDDVKNIQSSRFGFAVVEDEFLFFIPTEKLEAVGINELQQLAAEIFGKYMADASNLLIKKQGYCSVVELPQVPAGDIKEAIGTFYDRMREALSSKVA